MGHISIDRRAVRGIVAAAAIAVLAAGCGGETLDEPTAVAAEASAAEADAPEFGLVSPDEAAALAAGADVTVIDVRTPEEFGEGHLDGAVLIDFYDDSFADELATLDPDGTYLLYCRSGNRSGQATSIAAELGLEHVYDMDGGILAWNAEGRPLAP